MKHYLPLLCVAVLIGGCGKYQSQDEAKAACNQWREKYVEIEYTNKYRRGSIPSRECVHDEVTRQYLGYEGSFTEEATLPNPESRTQSRYYDGWKSYVSRYFKVNERFRY